jgi:CRISPR system Cascade subunit CasD
MPALLLRLVGPMQSWGTASRFQERDTAPEPSKSGVLGLLCAARGIDRSDWAGLAPLAALRFGVRRDRPGVPRHDYHTAGCGGNFGNGGADGIMKADGRLSFDGIVSKRHYLADAAFLAGFEGGDRRLLEKADAALRNPAWPLFLGRKSFVPSEPVWLENGVRDESLENSLRSCPCLDFQRRAGSGEPLLLSLEARWQTGMLRRDQPRSSFADRRFGSRYVMSFSVEVP